jgi:hypothetical protein
VLLAIGGHSRNIGKTSVTAGLIRAIPEAAWTAVKITQFGHGICSAAGRPCDCAVMDCEHPYAVDAETDASGRTDTSRFLVAGARRSYWVRTSVGQLGHAVPALARILNESANAIVESNSLLGYFKPDLYVFVLDPAVEDFKASARKYLSEAGAIVSIDRPGAPPLQRLWPAEAPVFRAVPPDYCPPDLAAFVRGRLR